MTRMVSIGDGCREARRNYRRLLSVTILLVLGSCGGGSNGSSMETQTLGDMSAAKTVWQQTVGSMSAANLNGGVGVSKGQIFGATANSDKGTISIWIWDGKRFGYGSEVALMNDWCGSSCTTGVDAVQIADLTREGDDDIFVSYHLNDPEGAVVSQVSGTWGLLPFDLDTHGADVTGSTVTAWHEPCLPSCGDGGAIPISYRWDGTQFVGIAVDELGNEFTPKIGPGCTTFKENDFEPYSLCDKGDGIRYLQQVLYDEGLLFSTSSNPVDGYFGPETEYSIKIFQYRNHLRVDGMVEGQWYHDLVENYNLLNGLGG